ncbi:uncharacterized protein LOC105703525 [Orussus abietinus]|uniref:uncharacterized protein LOC105703525 n=1 Tax=Orussus abietinus TaxID=222816 RepID=UPI0006253064|nr:uncharacterized protein LOC105703525 [Orussus abietinus]
MDREKPRTSRASSTSSLGREVRCACQYYQSDSLLPERRVLVGRPSSRAAMQTPPPQVSHVVIVPCDHEYEPIARPSSPSSRTPGHQIAPVVKITDTDVTHVADSDESFDGRGQYLPTLLLDGDVVLPLDGQIEDNAMEGRELGEAVDTSEEQETAQQLQDRLEERFLDAATPGTESRTDGEVNTSQVDSLALEELPLRRGARGLPQRLRSQAGKLRSRLKGIQRPSFISPSERQKPEKTKSPKPEKPRTEKRTRMERLRSSLPERPRFSLPDRPRFNLPDRSKFHLPERPRFSFPDKSRFSIKKPNIHLPGLSRSRKPKDQQRSQRSTGSSSGSKRNIFDFSTYPRIFDKKKKRTEYTTSSPKESRAQSAEVSTFPRARKTVPLSARWAQGFDDMNFMDDEPGTVVERAKPWRRPSMEEPRVALRLQDSLDEPDRVPWEESREDKEDTQGYDEYEEDSDEARHRSFKLEDSFDRGKIDPRLYGDQVAHAVYLRESEDGVDVVEVTTKWREGDLDDLQKEDAFQHQNGVSKHEKLYEPSFLPVDPREKSKSATSVKTEEEEEEEPAEEEQEESMPSDREQQQSSGSSCDRRRRGVIEELDSDEFFLRARGISQDDMIVGRSLAKEIREAFRSTGNALADDDIGLSSVPPQRPSRRSTRKRKDDSMESIHRSVRESIEEHDYDTPYPEKDLNASSRHHILYQAELTYADEPSTEPLDDIVVVKPTRKKSRSSIRSRSHLDSIHQEDVVCSTPPIAPRRRKRGRDELEVDKKATRRTGTVCNGHREWTEAGDGGAAEDMAFRKESRQDLPQELVHEYMETTPRPPKRISRSRTTSLAALDRVDRESSSARDRQIFSKMDGGYTGPAPVPPKRISRSRATSLAALNVDRGPSGIETMQINRRPTPIPPKRMSRSRATSLAILNFERSQSTVQDALRRLDRDYAESRPVPPKRISRSRTSLASLTIDRGQSSIFNRDTLKRLEHDYIEPAPVPPKRMSRSRTTSLASLNVDRGSSAVLNREALKRLEQDYIEPAPVAPKRLSRSRATSLAALDDDRTSRGAESLPEFGYDEDFPREDTVSRDLPGYATIDKREKPPRPPPPRRKRNKFSTTPRQSAPTRPIRAYSTLGPSRTSSAMEFRGSTPYVELDSDESELKDLRSGEVLSRMQGRPLPAPPRPPRVRRDSMDRPRDRSADALRGTVATEVVASTQTDPLPDDLVIEEEITQAKLVVAPSRTGSQILVSMERIPSPSQLSAAASIPAFPILSDLRREERSPSPDVPEDTPIESAAQERRVPTETERTQERAPTPSAGVEDSLRVTSLEVGDLRVDRLSVSQLDAQKISASELDTTVISASEVATPLSVDTSLHPSLLRELIAIRSHLEAVAAAQQQVRPAPFEAVLTSRATTESPRPTIERSSVGQNVDGLISSLQDAHLSDGDHEKETLRVLEDKQQEIRSRLPPDARASTEDLRQPASEPKPQVEVAYTAETSPDEPKTISPDDPKITEAIADSDVEQQRTRRARSTSRSRSSSPSRNAPVRQTASPVKSMPPVISVTPDRTDTVPSQVVRSEAQPQRAVISYSQEAVEEIGRDTREDSQSPVPSVPGQTTQFIAFPSSQIPAQFFSLASPTVFGGEARSSRIEPEPDIVDTTQQLLRALRLAGTRAMRHFVGYVSTRMSSEESREKIREVELALCALLLLVAGLLIVCFGSPRTVTHHHHWDYFNPPQ